MRNQQVSGVRGRDLCLTIAYHLLGAHNEEEMTTGVTIVVHIADLEPNLDEVGRFSD